MAQVTLFSRRDRKAFDVSSTPAKNVENNNELKNQQGLIIQKTNPHSQDERPLLSLVADFYSDYVVEGVQASIEKKPH